MPRMVILRLELKVELRLVVGTMPPQPIQCPRRHVVPLRSLLVTETARLRPSCGCTSGFSCHLRTSVRVQLNSTVFVGPHGHLATASSLLPFGSRIANVAVGSVLR